jgi:hypothetical protein
MKTGLALSATAALLLATLGSSPADMAVEPHV